MSNPATGAAIPRVKPDEFALRLARHNRLAAARQNARVMTWIAGTLTAAYLLDGTYKTAFFIIWTALGCLLYLVNAFRASDIPCTVPVFDRQLDLGAITRSPSIGRAIFLLKDELSSIAVRSGAASLHDFAESIHMGVARHVPSECIRSIDVILAHEHDLPEAVVSELRELHARLVIAAACNARFCLIESTGWSPAIEDNLHLYRC